MLSENIMVAHKWDLGSHLLYTTGTRIWVQIICTWTEKQDKQERNIVCTETYVQNSLHIPVLKVLLFFCLPSHSRTYNNFLAIALFRSSLMFRCPRLRGGFHIVTPLVISSPPLITIVHTMIIVWIAHNPKSSHYVSSNLYISFIFKIYFECLGIFRSELSS